jgi:hypothetical protein
VTPRSSRLVVDDRARGGIERGESITPNAKKDAKMR